jgi:hypothetical protein
LCAPFAALAHAGYGTKRPIRDVRYSAAIRGESRPSAEMPKST